MSVPDFRWRLFTVLRLFLVPWGSCYIMISDGCYVCSYGFWGLFLTFAVSPSGIRYCPLCVCAAVLIHYCNLAAPHRRAALRTHSSRRYNTARRPANENAVVLSHSPRSHA